MIEEVPLSVRAQIEAKKQNTPSRREGFTEGADYVLKALANEGFDAAVGSTVDALIRQVRSEIASAKSAQHELEKKREELRHLQFVGDLLDERAQGTVALVGALLEAFVSSVNRASASERGFSASHPSDMVQRKITEAVSYITWAYLTNGAPLPTVATISSDEE